MSGGRANIEGEGPWRGRMFKNPKGNCPRTAAREGEYLDLGGVANNRWGYCQGEGVCPKGEYLRGH